MATIIVKKAFLIAAVVLLTIGLICDTAVSERNDHKIQYQSSALSARLEKGKSELESIEKFAYRSGVPRNGECWRAALENLRISCSQLTEDIQVRLAIAFTSCFSAMIGQPNYICPPEEPVQSCMKAMDQDGVQSFRQFFLHTSDMCHYIESELWQIQTDRTVNMLHQATMDLGETVVEQKKTAESILSAQQEAHKVQEEMIKENSNMYETVVKMKDVFLNFSQSANEHQLIFLEIFAKLTRMQELVVWIQSEMSLIDFVLFYIVSSVFSYFATTAERTRQARAWLVIILGLGVCGERVIYDYMSSSNRTFRPDEILGTIALMRKALVFIMISTLVVTAAMYRDYNAENNYALKNLQESMGHVLDYIKKQEEFAQEQKAIVEPEPAAPRQALEPALIPIHNGNPAPNISIPEMNHTMNASESVYGTPLLDIPENSVNEYNTAGFLGRISDRLSNNRFSGRMSDFVRSKFQATSSPLDEVQEEGNRPFANLSTDDDSDKSFDGDEISTQQASSAEIEEPKPRYDFRVRRTPGPPPRPLYETLPDFRNVVLNRGGKKTPYPNTTYTSFQARSRSQAKPKSRVSSSYYSADEEEDE